MMNKLVLELNTKADELEAINYQLHRLLKKASAEIIDLEYQLNLCCKDWNILEINEHTYAGCRD